MSGFQRATRQRVFLKLALTGPSGSGKTFSALRLAFGLGTKIAVIDTENESASLYAGLGEYDVMVLAAPFTVDKYVKGIKEAHSCGYDVVIIDSLSHAWAGDGGLLDQKSAKDARGGNGFSNWAEVSKQHEAMKSALLQTPIHVIATMRSKQDYVLEVDERGRSTPKKVAMAPIQRDGMEYEFTCVFDVAMDHRAITSKDRTGLFTDETSQITEGHGKRLQEWLSSGASPVSPAIVEQVQQAATTTQEAQTAQQEAEPAKDWEAEFKRLMRLYKARLAPFDLLEALLGRSLPDDSDWNMVYKEACEVPSEKWETFRKTAAPKAEAPKPAEPAKLSPAQDEAFSDWIANCAIDRVKFSEVVGRDLPCNEIGFSTLADEELVSVNEFIKSGVMPRNQKPPLELVETGGVK